MGTCLLSSFFLEKPVCNFLCDQVPRSQAGDQRCRQKAAFGLIYLFRHRERIFCYLRNFRFSHFFIRQVFVNCCSLNYSLFQWIDKLIFHRIVVTTFDAVKAGDAATVIDLFIFGINARCFTLHGAQAAHITFVIHKLNFTQGIFAQKTERGAHRTNRVAISPAVAPGQIANHSQRNKSDRRRENAQRIDAYLVKRVIIEGGKNGFQ